MIYHKKFQEDTAEIIYNKVYGAKKRCSFTKYDRICDEKEKLKNLINS